MNLIWLSALRQNARAMHSFEEYIEHLKGEAAVKLKRAPTWEETLRLQGEIRRLDNITNIVKGDLKAGQSEVVDEDAKVSARR